MERVYSPLRIFRPAVKGIVENMSNEDKMLVEEGFQRLVLQYDRVFTGERLFLHLSGSSTSYSQSSCLLLAVVKTPSCLWRRTGQIFKANAEYVLRCPGSFSFHCLAGLTLSSLSPLDSPS